ncbi:hypothetical protein G3580_10185 [Nitrogeniibacter mangrovi]|uniref:Hemerythrin-like domain-containing protein n=1 Tax=Nitrogeniibacter mangrovi TaxID=2016596 RepID=A0A6C1B2W7_9RHOO|nr:hypothetical protein [Nitrogeniibacter mangrovi]QID17976.1 hypothetical protein G3580_10185 [Nitrogeniibacter mangrovi]
MTISENTLAKLHADHAYMDALIRQIAGLCVSRGAVDSCDQCRPNRRTLCRSNVEQLIHTFVQVTLKHNLLESQCMEDEVPAEHRIAHNRAHARIGEQLQQLRAIFADDGNSLVAIEGIDRVQAALDDHLIEFDEALEAYLKAA